MRFSEVVRRQYNLFDHYDVVAQKAGWYVPSEVASALLVHRQYTDEENILDVGCGTGHAGRELRRHGFRGRLLGLDIAERRLAQANASGWYDLTRVGDAHNLPWDFSGFDGVVSSAMLGLAGPQALNEMLRVLRCDRLLSATAWYVRGRREMVRRYDAVLRRLDKLVSARRVEVLVSRDLGSGSRPGYHEDERYRLFVLRKRSDRQGRD